MSEDRIDRPPFTWERMKLKPSSGQFVKEDGSLISWSDYLQTQKDFDILTHTVGNGNVAILSIRLDAQAAQTDHYFVIDIPPGKQFVLSQRLLSLTQGRYLIDAVAVDTFDPTGANVGIVAGMDKRRPVICDTRIRRVGAANITNPVAREFGFVDTGVAQTGQARTSGSMGAEEFFKVLVGPSPLRIRKTDEGTFTVNLTFIGWEEDLEIFD